MKYIEVTFKIDDTDFFRDLLVDTLGNEGPYESFVDTPDGMKAYVPLSEYDPQFLAATVQAFPLPLQYHATEMEDKDWNAEWEKNHDAVLVRYNGGSIWVRAPFHPHRNDVDYELLIEPKMSFGTAHHPTTYMMLSFVAEHNVKGRRVLDMGCGTAVLGILASMRGADYVAGIDIDEWAFANARENAQSNNAQIDLQIGDASLLAAMQPFDMILANINRNILMHDMEAYVPVLNNGGELIISGFYEADEGALIQCGNQLGLHLTEKKTRDGWCALCLKKD